MTEGVRPQPHERLGDTDPGLDRHLAGRVVHDDVEVGGRLELCGQRARRRFGLHVQHPPGSHVGHRQPVGVLVIAQRAGPVAVQVDGPESGRALPHREREDGAHARLDRWWRER